MDEKQKFLAINVDVLLLCVGGILLYLLAAKVFTEWPWDCGGSTGLRRLSSVFTGCFRLPDGGLIERPPSQETWTELGKEDSTNGRAWSFGLFHDRGGLYRK